MAQASDAARQYSRAHGDRLLQELEELIRIPSISTDPAHAGDIQHAADWLAAPVRGLGAENVAVMPTAGQARVAWALSPRRWTAPGTV
jgi:acetylornithine deacetylase/succinyl-diaminopimelate desuccinylase-like protein